MSMHPAINYFAEYKQDCINFIETGTYRGDGIQLAFDAGFLTIHSVDIVSHELNYRYPGHGQAHLYIGHSPEILRERILPYITGRCMFWLDAHSQLFEGEPDNFPLLDELREIARHERKDHVILIDDILYMTHPDITGWSRKQIESAILEINPCYKFTYLSNPVRRNILLATI